MENKYCIACEEDVIADDRHVKFIPLNEWQYDTEICLGPFASVQPPENFENDWDLNLVEPGQEELAIMNCYAEELMQDFEME